MFSSKLVYSVVSFIGEPLAHIYNSSLTKGIFPNNLKIARVIPIYKRKGDACNPDNYRPISLVSTFSKLFEKIIVKRLHKFLSKNNILYKYQFGFSG